MASPDITSTRQGPLACWGPQQTAVARYDDYIPILLGAAQALLKGFMRMSRRDAVWLVLSVAAMLGAWLLWPILFSLRVDGTTSMSWATVWIPLWIADGIGLLFFLFLVSWGRIGPPAGWEGGEWQDPYPLAMRVLALAKWILLLIFQVFLVRQLDHRTSWPWGDVLSPLIAWVCLRAFGALCRLRLQKRRLFMGRVIEAVKVVSEGVIFLLQLLFIIWRVNGDVDWSWWVVFIPAWVLHTGQLLGWCANQALALALARGIEDHGGYTEGEQKRILEASLLMDNARYSRHVFGGSLVFSILTVNLLAGADYSTFVIFIPEFISVAWVLCGVSCLVCCARRRSEEFEIIDDIAPGV